MVTATAAADGTVTVQVLDFAYDNAGTPYALTYTNGTADPVVYYYITNLQGDVVSLVNASGTEVAAYTYDPYGQLISATGTLADRNPLRYRGYYYDEETGFYYLQSRYYDPTLGRFINADGMTTTGQGFIGYNMFAYCGNNPVNRVDPSGQFWGVIVGFCTAMAALLSGCSSDDSQSSGKAEDSTYPGNANCYAYAMKWSLDPRTGEPFTEKPQPGCFSSTGYDPRTNYAAALISSNVEDPVERMRYYITTKVSSDLEVLGMTFIKVDGLSHAPQNGNWLVALAFDPGSGDYHWWRQNTDGTWYHKPGNAPISTVDNSGAVIYDPANCDRGNYTVFWGYYEVGYR